MIRRCKTEFERLSFPRRAGEMLRRPLGMGKPRVNYRSGEPCYTCRIHLKKWHGQKGAPKDDLTFTLYDLFGTGESIPAARLDLSVVRKELAWGFYKNTLSKHNPYCRAKKGIWAHRYKGRNRE